MLNHLGKIALGHYPGTDDFIYWDCIEAAQGSEGSSRFISCEGIVAIPFQKVMRGEGQAKGWYFENSDLKKWLREDFLPLYFKAEERIRIKNVSVPSASEMREWFPDLRARACAPLERAVRDGAAVYKSYGNQEACVYWLSDTGRKAGMSAAVVMANGQIYPSAYLSAANVCVRPVIELEEGK